jgi:hypothetical protein
MSDNISHILRSVVFLSEYLPRSRGTKQRRPVEVKAPVLITGSDLFNPLNLYKKDLPVCLVCSHCSSLAFPDQRPPVGRQGNRKVPPDLFFYLLEEMTRRFTACRKPFSSLNFLPT